ncbi:MAG: DUF3445 domain-containing protein [Verrucomicrobia bacterium]|nr:DUF3445 domain-containing protein [Verrucomicrobiota bacterium]
MNLSSLLPDEDFRHSMRFSKGTLSGFYGATIDRAELLGQRSRWIAEQPGRYAAMSAGSESMLDEATNLANDVGGIDGETFDRISKERDPLMRCRLLGTHWEPDFLLMKSTDSGLPRLLGGCVCFPSHWSLQEKLGKSMDAIHSPVPELNADLGRQINGFLSRIKPGTSWERTNWGLAATSELNLHPALSPPRLPCAVEAGDAWLRIEWQSLVALPVSKGILFGIRLQIVPLVTVMQDADVKRRLYRALATMPVEMARYKGLGECRDTLLELLALER